MKAIVAGLIGLAVFSPAAIAQDVANQYASAFHAFQSLGKVVVTLFSPKASLRRCCQP